MGNFNRDNKRSEGGFNSGSGGGKRFGDRHDRPMFRAICSECGASCEVPFRPTGDKPIYCSNCFDKQRGGEGRPNRFSGERQRHEDKPMYYAVCAKCGQACQVPFRPTGDKPVYCNDCFDRSGSVGGKDSGEVLDQLKKLNSKIDRLMEALISATGKGETPKAKKETPAEKPAKPEKVKAEKAKTKKAAPKKAAGKKK